ncbi:hypothetical protein YPPY19_3542, partial [Yersinia pestis PY-19]
MKFGTRGLKKPFISAYSFCNFAISTTLSYREYTPAAVEKLVSLSDNISTASIYSKLSLTTLIPLMSFL